MTPPLSMVATPLGGREGGRVVLNVCTLSWLSVNASKNQVIHLGRNE